MTFLFKGSGTAVALAMFATIAPGQSFNVDIGDPGSVAGVPTNSYGAGSGVAGPWNTATSTSVPAYQVLGLTDVNGAVTTVDLTQLQVVTTNGLGDFGFNNPGTTGDDQALMDDLQDIGNVGAISEYTFSGLTDGSYDLYTYAWAPDSSAFVAAVTPTGRVTVQVNGNWPGMQVEGTTYARHTVMVSGGSLAVEVETISGFASVNGLQLVMNAPPAPGPGDVVINEFVYDDSGTDDREYVELYNTTGATIDIGDWVLDAEDPGGPGTAYTIPNGTMLAAGDYYVLGAATVANVDQVLGVNNLWENGQDSLTLRDPSTNIIDTLVYEGNKGLWDSTLAEGDDGVHGNFTSIDGTETSCSRVRDGLDSDNNGLDFVLAPSTPGTSNNLASSDYADNYDALVVGSTLADTIGSFVNATVIDPTVADANNPGAIAGSPQGGNAIVTWDASGGGNTVVLRRELTGRTVLEAYVYVDVPTISMAAEFLHWNIGFGTTGTFSNAPDPSNTLGAGFTANGSTGVSWLYQAIPGGSGTGEGTLYLVDHNDGGWSGAGSNAVSTETVLGSIAITPGMNDGWQRIYLERNGCVVTGVFGGTYGSGTSTGTVFTGAVDLIGSTTCYVGYRENDGVAGIPAWVRPCTLDDVSVSSSDPSAGTDICFGNGTGASCPCGNDDTGGVGGCSNSAGRGAVLSNNGDISASSNGLTFGVTGGASSSFGVLVSGDNALGGGLGIVGLPMKDGLRCVGGNSLRHGNRALNAAGCNPDQWGSLTGPPGGIIGGGGFVAGQTRHFQVRYRDNVMTSPCSTDQNTSQATSITFTM